MVATQRVEIGKEVEEEVGGDGTQLGVLVLTPVVSRVAHREEDQLLVGCPRLEEGLEDAGRLEVAA